MTDETGTTPWRRHTRDTTTGSFAIGGRHPVVLRAAVPISPALPVVATAAAAEGCGVLLVRGWSQGMNEAVEAEVIRGAGVEVVAEVPSTVAAVARARLLGCAGVRLVVRDEEAFSRNAPAIARVADHGGLSLELALSPVLPRGRHRPLVLAEAFLRICAVLEANRFTNIQLSVTCTDPLTVGQAARMLAVASDYPLLPVLLPSPFLTTPAVSAAALTCALILEGVCDGVWLPCAGGSIAQAQLGRLVLHTATRQMSRRRPQSAPGRHLHGWQ